MAKQEIGVKGSDKMGIFRVNILCTVVAGVYDVVWTQGLIWL